MGETNEEQSVRGNSLNQVEDINISKKKGGGHMKEGCVLYVSLSVFHFLTNLFNSANTGQVGRTYY